MAQFRNTRLWRQNISIYAQLIDSSRTIRAPINDQFISPLGNMRTFSCIYCSLSPLLCIGDNSKDAYLHKIIWWKIGMFFGERLVFELPPWSKYVRPEGVSGCKYAGHSWVFRPRGDCTYFHIFMINMIALVLIYLLTHITIGKREGYIKLCSLRSGLGGKCTKRLKMKDFKGGER